MNSEKIGKLIFASLFTALTCVATLAIRVPTPIGGYVHAGDALVLLGALVLGGGFGAFAAGLGSALADIISGYAIYAPGTLIIKALVAVCASVLFRKNFLKNTFAKAILAGIISELIMVAGYLAYDSIVLGYGAAAIADVPANLLQAAFGAAAGSALFSALISSEYIRSAMPELKRYYKDKNNSAKKQ